MFALQNSRMTLPQACTAGTSLLIHGVLLGWLLHAPNARVLAPASVAAGNYGTSVSHLYWPRQSNQGETVDSEFTNPARTTARRHKLDWETHRKDKTPAAPATNAANSSPAVAAAGMPYGTLSTGPASGDEIRPALPLSASDPVVDPRDLAGHGEGSVIVEVTIDDKGNIIQKVVLQSLGPVIDNKVLAALESWHFRPATRNGVAIPSKQDVYYHFKPTA